VYSIEQYANSAVPRRRTSTTDNYDEHSAYPAQQVAAESLRSKGAYTPCSRG